MNTLPHSLQGTSRTCGLGWTATTTTDGCGRIKGVSNTPLGILLIKINDSSCRLGLLFSSPPSSGPAHPPNTQETFSYYQSHFHRPNASSGRPVVGVEPRSISLSR